MKISFLFTCYNRKEKTINCVETIKKAVSYCDTKGISIEDEWFITDAGSDDGTVEELRKQYCSDESGKTSKMHIRVEGKDTFYSVGMRKCMEAYFQLRDERNSESDYIFLINDDVDFYEDFLYRMLTVHDNENQAGCESVLVGATEYEGKQTYGGVRYNKQPAKTILPRSVRYEMARIDADDRKCHTFNANCVMIPAAIIDKCGIMDGKYVHSLGDFDYGMCIYEQGYLIESAAFVVGKCPNNSRQGSWMDTSLTRRERVKKLNSIKGAPSRYWFYYLNKHFGLLSAFVHTLTPYIKIIIKK